MAYNTLVVYDPSDSNRIVHVEQIYKGLPTIEPLEENSWNGGPIFDSTAHEYLVGVMNYDDADFDSTTNLLTETACTKYGVTSDQKEFYLKDVEITIPVANDRASDMVFDTTSYELSQDVLLSAYRERYLKITPETLSGVTLDSTSIDGLPIYSVPDTPGSSYIRFSIQKIDSDETPMVSEDDDDTIWVLTTAGKIEGPENLQIDLVNGEAEFDLVIPDESILITISVKCAELDKNGQPIISGSYSFRINSVATG